MNIDCDNPEHDDIVFCLDLFNIMSTGFLKYLAEHLAYSGTYDDKFKDIAREFLLKVLPVENQIVIPHRYFRDDVSRDDVFDAWTVAFSQLKAIGRDRDICEWFNNIKYYYKTGVIYISTLRGIVTLITGVKIPRTILNYHCNRQKFNN